MEIKINNVKPHYENFDAKSLDIDYTVSFGLMALNGIIEDVGSDDIGSMSIYDMEDLVRQCVTESIKNEIELMQD